MLSVLIPCYNEKETIKEIIDKVLKVPTNLEVIVVDDGSRDGSRDILKTLQNTNPKLKIYFHEKNQGKGAAIATGLEHADGDIMIVQDADLEYEPMDYIHILEKFNDPEVQVVYGNRWHNKNQRHSYFSFFLGGLLVTFWTNFLFGSRIHDEPTCYKAFRKSTMQSILPLRSRGFEFCPEVTAKILRKGIAIHEVPIAYYPRSFDEGKKISWKDGLKALWVLTKIKFTGNM